MKKILRISLWIFIGLFVWSIVASILFSTLFKDELKTILLKEFNKQLNAELVINGESTVSLFEFFPNASFSFQDIFIRDSLNERQNLLEAESLTFLFNFNGALKSQYNFEELVMKNGKVNIHIDKDGKSNYDIFKEEQTEIKKERGDKDTSIKLKKAEFKNVHFAYVDEQSNLNTALQVDHLKLNGLDYQGDQYQIKAKGDGVLENYQVEETAYLSNQEVEVNLQLSANTKENVYNFKESEVALGGNDFSLDGKIQMLKEGYDVDFQTKGIKLSLDEFLELIPEESRAYISDWKINGDFDFSAIMKGKYKNQYYPNIQADFLFEDGTITPKSLGYPMKNFNCSAKFTNGVLNHGNTSLFTLNKIDFNLLGNPIHFDGEISNLNHPKLKGIANGKLDLYALKGYVKKHFGIENLEGAVDFQNWSFNGDWADFKTASKYPQSQGTVVLEEIALKYNKGKVNKINGIITTQETDWFCENVVCELPKSTIAINGKFENLSPFLLQWSDSLKAEQVIPEFTLDLLADKLVLADLQNLRPPPIDSLAQKNESIEAEEPLPPVEGMLSFNIGQLQMEKTAVDSISGSLCLKDKTYRIENCAFDVFDGRGLLSGVIAPFDQNHEKFNGNLKFGNLNLKEMMKEMEDFEQDYLSYKNIEGALNVNLILETRLDENWYADKNKIEAWADVELIDGKLLNFEPIMEMMDLKDKKRMQKIEFQPIRNQFVIKNRSVKIPKMEIKSNIVNVEFSGRHNLNNSIHYHFKVDLLDYFSKRFFNRNEGDVVEKNQKGGINYYFSLFEEASDPVFKKGNKEMVLQQFRKAAVFNPVDIDRKISTKYGILWECR